jgi:2-polyprenyl-3-methyl-5-hydroxy-6-metoxy-1,4-benzoquinol methylase
LASDAAYEQLTKPLIESLLPFAGPRLLDLGCGEGRIARHLRAAGREIVGLDRNPELISEAGVPSLIAELPYLDAVRNGSFDGAYVVLVLEHVADLSRFF